MDINVKISSDSARVLMDELLKRKNVLEGQLTTIKDELETVDRDIKNIQTAESDTVGSELIASFVSDMNAFNTGWAMEKKIKYILNKEGQPMTTSGIAAKILEFEPKLDRSKLVSNISAVISMAISRKKAFIRNKNKYKENVYELNSQE